LGGVQPLRTTNPNRGPKCPKLLEINIQILSENFTVIWFVFFGDRSKIFQVMCHGMRIKISLPNLGVPRPEILEPKEIDFNSVIMQLCRE